MIGRAVLLAAALAFCSLPARALELQAVTDGVWAIVGEKEQRSSRNLANNATFGLVVTDEGAVLIDPGGSWKGAEALHGMIRQVTAVPVRYVINTGGQDHRWLGNGYWRTQGASIIASEAAVADQMARGSMQLSALSGLLGEAVAGTEPVYADVTFDEHHSIAIGGITLDLHHPGSAHTPGDTFVWVAAKDTVFSGDIVYVERILGVGEQSSISEWPASFEALEATGAAHVVPGHGHATTMARARADTYAYLMNLRARIGELIGNGGGIMDATSVDQSAFAHLEQFDALARRNAETAFKQMEWE